MYDFTSTRDFFMNANFTHTKKIVTAAMLAALGFAISLWEFPVFPATPFLKLDFSNLTTMLGGFLLGPVYAVAIEAAKQLLRYTITSSFGIGEIANLIITISFVLPGSILYIFKKGRLSAIIGMLMGIMLQVAMGLLSNRYIMFPLFFQAPADPVDMFNQVWVFIMLFNLIKATSISIIVMLLYKHLSRALKWVLGKGKKGKEVANEPSEEYNEGADETK